MSEKVWESIKQVMKVEYGISSDKFERDTEVSEKIDSLETVEMVMFIEEALNIEVTDDEISSFKTFGDVEKLCQEKVSQKPTGL